MNETIDKLVPYKGQRLCIVISIVLLIYLFTYISAYPNAFYSFKSDWEYRGLWNGIFEHTIGQIILVCCLFVIGAIAWKHTYGALIKWIMKK